MSVFVLAIGSVGEAVLAEVRSAVHALMGLRVSGEAVCPEPRAAFDGKRRQYSSPLMMAAALACAPPDAARVIAVTERDLFIPMLTFVFGQAQCDGRLALMSSARLDPGFYSLAPDLALCGARIRKEAAHELGHTFGLIHCEDRTCVMSLATNIMHVDRKQERFCAGCRQLLSERSSHLKENEDEGKLAHFSR